MLDRGPAGCQDLRVTNTHGVSEGSRRWHALVAAVAAVALASQVIIVMTTPGRSLLNLVSFFTIQSNALVLAGSAVIALGRASGRRWFVVLRLAGLVGITVTGLVYVTLLRGTADFTGYEWWVDKMLHYATPVLYVLGFVLFRPRIHFGAGDVGRFLLWPVLWVTYTLLRGGLAKPHSLGFPSDSNYPYPFLDVDVHGYAGVTVNALGITVLLLVVAAVYVRLGRGRWTGAVAPVHR